MPADPKPARRVRDPKAGVGKVLSEAVCRVCRSTRRTDAFWYRLHRHHLVSRAQGGDDTDDNIVPLCQPCHQDYHDSAKLHRAIATAIRGTLTRAEAAYVTSRKSAAWLDSKYPRPKPRR